MKKFNQFREDSLLEVLKASDPTGKWISDFVHSDNPKFAGKSKKERIQMALGASYASKRNEEVDLDEAIKLGSKVKMHAPGKDYHEQEGHVGEIRHGLYKGAPKKYTIDYGNGQSIQLGKSSIKHQTPDKWHAEEIDIDEASPMIKPPSNRFDNKKEAFTHAKTHGGKVFKSTYIDPNTGNKNITFVVKKEQGVAEGLNEMDKTQTPPGRDGDIDWSKKQIHLGPEHVIKGKDVAQHALKALDKSMKKSHPNTLKKKGVAEAKDSREYDFEGDMAKSQLRSIIANAQRAHDMLEDDTNMAEWVQSKITLAADYISTVADYMQSEVKEEVEPIEELNKDTVISYDIRAHKDQDKQFAIIDKAIKANDPKTANKASHKFSKRSAGLDRAETRLNKENTEVAEARMSAAQRLWNAEQKQRAKSDASLARTPSSIPKPEEKK